MSKEMVISSNRHETRVALLEDDQLCEVYFQRANEYSLAGSIHKGRVTRVLPGMQSAFVDLGLERDTFLYVSDFLEDHEDFDTVTGDERPERPERGERSERPERGRDRDRGRGERGDREGNRERRQALPPTLPPSALAPPAASPEAGAPAAAEGISEPAPALGPTATLAAPQGEGVASPGGDRGDGRSGDGGGDRGDRRGRRSRRRRNRGRGFPDSKYAEAGPAERPAGGDRPREDRPSGERPPAIRPALAPVMEVETEEEHESGAAPMELPPLVLPGESLAKYRGGAMPPPLPVEAFIQSKPLDVEPDIDVEEEEFNEPIHYPPENALPDAPRHHTAPVAEAPPPGEPVPHMVPAQPAAAVEEVSDDADDDEADQASGSGPVVAPMLDEDEDRDIQAMILGEIEEMDSEEADAEEEAGEAAPEGSETVEPGVEVAPVEGAAPLEGAALAEGEQETGTAEVRERGGRYPHRISRRTRRRGGRGPQPQEGADGAPATPRPAEQERERSIARPSSGGRPSGGNTVQVSITDMLKEGQEIIVQIAKEPLGQKGARITSHIALPGRYVVYMPTLEHMGVSRKISSDEERLRLKRILQGRKPGPTGGFITRTAAEGRTEEEIAADMEFLYKLWQDIKNKAERKPAPLLLHHDLDIVQRVLRDQLTDNFKSIWIDNEELYESVVSFVQRFQPALVGKVKLYTREAPIFDSFGITGELEKALRPKVWLKSGGYIVINQTEALVAIDVNTGKYVGKSNRLEDTIVKTNTEAIKEIVRQIRLRDLGGIIVIDFIDMDERKNRQKVMQALEEAMRADRAPYKILQFNDFGLVAITRKRVKQSLERTLCSPCPHCDGSGSIKSVQTVVSEILTEARKMSASVEGKDVMLRVHPDVAKILKSHQNKYLEELEEMLRRPVLVKSDPLLHHEKFDLA